MYLIFMGVSGSGKSTFAQRTAEVFGLPFFEADDFHPEHNVTKMASGQPLTDQDRVLWLEKLCAAINGAGAERAVISCSALTPFVRATLKDRLSTEPVYLLLDVPEAMIRRRMDAREGHFMPSSLLASQFEALTLPEGVIRITNEGDLSAVFQQVRTVVKDLFAASEQEGQDQGDQEAYRPDQG